MLALLFASILFQFPTEYDLRDVDGECFVSAVREQSGGTCWAHGTMASLESNLLLSGIWEAAGETGEPDLAEYHLDWWNGFNSFWNPDLEYPFNGLAVHQGGDYLISAAYTARGDGAVREADGQSFNEPPLYNSVSFHHFVPLSISWLTAGWDIESLNSIKSAVMTGGAVATCLYSSSSYLSDEFIHYQPLSAPELPTHAVAIIGWNDTLQTQAHDPGAWLCRNSWGQDWGLDGCFWISYWDKWAGREPFMGAVSFTEVQFEPFTKVFFHDLHGWRDCFTGTERAMNAFSADEQCSMSMISFFTAVDSVNYDLELYSSMSGGEPSGLICSKSGFAENRGLHTVETDQLIQLSAGDSIYVLADLDRGGHPFDRTADVPVLLGSSMDVIVGSAASPGESFYYSGEGWKDFWQWEGNPYPGTGNFCIKLLGFWTGLHVFPQHSFQFTGNGVEDPFFPESASWTIVHSGSPAEYNVTTDADWLVLSGSTSGVVTEGSSVVITATPVPFQADEEDSLKSASILFENLSDPLNSITRQAFLQITKRSLLYSWPLNTDPEWEMTGEWSWGCPEGFGGGQGFPDPVSGHTGSNVLGYNLTGNYSNNIQEPYYAVTQPFSCSGASNIQLRYRRWLGAGQGDTAEIVGSGDFGVSGWQSVWSNSNQEIFDSLWVSCVHSISGFADNSETVSIVWLMGSTNSEGSECGWNIDDIEIWGIKESSDTPVIPEENLMGSVFPNPAFESVSVYFRITSEGLLNVSIHDLSGRLVRTGFTGPVDPGVMMISLDLGGLPAGWYGVRATMPGQSSSSSFIKL